MDEKVALLILTLYNISAHSIYILKQVEFLPRLRRLLELAFAILDRKRSQTDAHASSAILVLPTKFCLSFQNIDTMR